MTDSISIGGRKHTRNLKWLVQESCLPGAELAGNPKDVWENNPEQEQQQQ